MEQVWAKMILNSFSTCLSVMLSIPQWIHQYPLFVAYWTSGTYAVIFYTVCEYYYLFTLLKFEIYIILRKAWMFWSSLISKGTSYNPLGLLVDYAYIRLGWSSTFLCQFISISITSVLHAVRWDPLNYNPFDFEILLWWVFSLPSQLFIRREILIS